MRVRTRQGGMHRLALVLFLVVAGCALPGGTTPPSPAGDPQGSWQLIAAETPDGPIELLDEHPFTLTLEASTVGGQACNHYGGRIEPAAGGIAIHELGSTDMACAPDGVMVAEAAYLEALTAVRAIRRDGDELVLEGPGVELHYELLPGAPVTELVDTTWVLETLLVGDVASGAMGEPATLLLRSDGTLEGETGCRSFTGRWIEAGHQIQATELFMDDRVCPADLAPQDGHVVSVIGDGFVPSVEGDLLTLMDPGGVGLVYRASE
jgi:heat shock protein HslJ